MEVINNDLLSQFFEIVELCAVPITQRELESPESLRLTRHHERERRATPWRWFLVQIQNFSGFGFTTGRERA